jgi:hypothetical protein
MFMTRLERSSRFADVALKSAKQETQFNVDMKRFRIVCTKAAASQPDENKADKK